MSLDQILTAYAQRTDPGAETPIVASHLQQMGTFILRQGIRIHPEVDGPQKLRQQFIDELWDQNRLDLYLWGIIEQFLIRGSILWYVRPTASSFKDIRWFHGGRDDSESQYKIFYKPGGTEYDYVVVRYSYVRESAQGYNLDASYNKVVWVRLIITADLVIEEEWAGGMPPLNLKGYGPGRLISRNEQVNSLGFIPCVESPNDPGWVGDRGSGDFHRWGVGSLIEAHDDMVQSMTQNIFDFGNGTLVTTRSSDAVMKQMGQDARSNTQWQAGTPSWSEANGFFNSNLPGPDGIIPFRNRSHSASQRRKGGGVVKVIGNVRSDERFGYIYPDPINADQWRYQQDYRGMIHSCLGGVDPLSHQAGLDWTAFRGLMGHVETTSIRKANALFKHGLCKAFEIAIWIEEKIFFQTYRYALAKGNPKKMEKITDDQILDHFYNSEVVPSGIEGLPPYGSRTCKWSWLGDVYPPTPQEKNYASILIRNLQEVGLGTTDALRESGLFPGKNDEDLRQLMTGAPFRYTNETVKTLAGVLGLIGNMMSIPDYDAPDMPLAASINLKPLLQMLIDNLASQLNQNQDSNYDPRTPGDEPIWVRPQPNPDDANLDGTSGDAATIAAGSAPTGIDYSSSIPIGAAVSKSNGSPMAAGAASSLNPDAAPAILPTAANWTSGMGTSSYAPGMGIHSPGATVPGVPESRDSGNNRKRSSRRS